MSITELPSGGSEPRPRARGARLLERLRARRGSWLTYLAIMGPGLIAATAGNDAGGITTYATAGASFGYRMLWIMPVTTVGLVVVQEMCARMGAVTGEGLSGLIRERLGIRWTALIMLALFISNAATVVSEFVGIAASLELFAIPRWLVVPLVAVGLWWLIAGGSYRLVERVFILMALVFLSYIVAAFMAGPDWGHAVGSLVVPSFSLDRVYLLTVVALIGTTITPYMQVFVQSSVAEKGITMRDYRYQRADVYIGTIFSSLIAFFIIVATAATLNTHGIVITSAADAAQALEPLAGPYAKVLFGVGLFGASILAAGVLPLATSYSLAEAFGFEKGISRSFREAPVFVGIFTGLLALGALIALIPGLDPVPVILAVQVLSGLLLPIVLFAILRLVNDREVMGQYVNGWVTNAIAYPTAILITLLSLIYVVSNLIPGF